MDLFNRAMRVIGFAIAGPIIGAVLSIVAIGLLGGLVAILQVDWRHSDALTDVAASSMVIGMIFGTFLGAPIGAIIGLIVGLIRGFQTPANRCTAAAPPARPLDEEFGEDRGYVGKQNVKPRRTWWAFWGRLGLAVLALAVALNLLWTYQLHYERRETTARLEQIASGDGAVRREALDVIGKLGPYAAPTVSQALASPDREMQKAALLASHAVLDHCLGVLGEMNCGTGFIPGRGAAYRGFQRLVTALSQTLWDEDRAIRLDAARALSHIHEFQWEGIEPPARRIQAVIHEGLQANGDPAAKKDLIGFLADPLPRLLSEGTTALVEATNDPDEGTRRAAIQALVEVLAKSKGPREKDGRNALRGVAPLLLSEARTSKNSLALIELGDLGEPEAVAALRDQLRDADEATKAGAAVALRRLAFLAFGAEDVDAVRIRDELRGCVPSLVAALDDPTLDVRRRATEALQSLGAASLPAIPALEKAAEREPDQFVRQAMMEACRDINASAESERVRSRAAPARGGIRPPP